MRALDFAPVIAVKRAMRGFPNPWWVSGGWAIDLFVGSVTREHHDVEVGLFYPAQDELRKELDEWELWRIRNGAWEPWHMGDVVERPEFQLQARSRAEASTTFDLFLDAVDGREWVSRRHDRLRRPAPEIVSVTSGRSQAPPGVPYLVPEIQLLYKAKAHRPQDEADFDIASPLLSPGARRWLREALVVYHPGDPWIGRL